MLPRERATGVFTWQSASFSGHRERSRIQDGLQRAEHHCDTTYLREMKLMATTMVHVRVDQRTKEKAAKTLAGMGISVSDAVRMLRSV